MASLTNEIADIIKKFDKDEILLDKLLDERIKQESRLEHLQANTLIVSISREDAIKRNNKLLKDLETVKGRLRSKSIFTTTELQWDKICRKYQESPSLLATKWRCHLPIYV